MVALAFFGGCVRTNVYVDGFNLYFGALKKTPYRWLNVLKLCQFLLPNHHIHQIKYFTALVKPRPNDLTQPIRQQIYLRALQTIPNLKIIYGHYLSHRVMMPLAQSMRKKIQYVEVIKTEEKGSDVNLATHLLHDAYQNDYEVGVIISNDSDLVEPVKIVINHLGLKVGIINPHQYPSQALLKEASFYKKIRPTVLKLSQFPDSLKDEHGVFFKPNTW